MPDAKAEDAFAAAITRCALEAAWRRLTAREREVAALRLKGLTQAEIGSRLGVSTPRVCVLLRRVRQRLGALLADA